jgi:hypothetical protein
MIRVSEQRVSESGRNSGLSWLSRSGRQHGEEVTVTSDIAAASQLGAVGNDAADPRADQPPAADEVGRHQLADPQGEPHAVRKHEMLKFSFW